jgi:hypothetical protein
MPDRTVIYALRRGLVFLKIHNPILWVCRRLTGSNSQHVSKGSGVLIGYSTYQRGVDPLETDLSPHPAKKT